MFRIVEMKKFVNLAFALLMLCACRSKESTTEVKFIVKDNNWLPYGWYRMLKQFPNTREHAGKGGLNAAAYLCANMDTGDTILVLCTKTRERLSNNFEVVLYPDYDVNVGDTLLFTMDEEVEGKYQRYKRAVGKMKVLLE